MSVKEILSEENVSAAQYPAQKDPWVHGQDENAWRPSNLEKAESEGKKTPDGVNKGSFSFGKRDKLLKRHEFQNVLQKGKRARGTAITFIFIQNGLDRSRLGLVVGRKVGKAHFRNRIKRLIREVFRLNRSLLPGNIDLVAQVYPGNSQFDYKNIEQEFVRFAQRVAG